MAEHEYKTNNRAKIMDFLLNNKDRMVSVADIEKHLEDEKNPVNKTTIYRYLEKLEADGNIIKCASDQGDKTTTYQYVDRAHKCDEHLHLKCMECGAIIHLDCEFMDEIAEHVQKDHGFTIQCKNSIIYGICERCQKKYNSAK